MWLPYQTVGILFTALHSVENASNLNKTQKCCSKRPTHYKMPYAKYCIKIYRSVYTAIIVMSRFIIISYTHTVNGMRVWCCLFFLRPFVVLKMHKETTMNGRRRFQDQTGHFATLAVLWLFLADSHAPKHNSIIRHILRQRNVRIISYRLRRRRKSHRLFELICLQTVAIFHLLRALMKRSLWLVSVRLIAYHLTHRRIDFSVNDPRSADVVRRQTLKGWIFSPSTVFWFLIAF